MDKFNELLLRTPMPRLSQASQQEKENLPKENLPNYQLFIPLLFGPLLPLIQIGFRGKLPQHQINYIYFTGLTAALGHAGYVMVKDSSM